MSKSDLLHICSTTPKQKMVLTVKKDKLKAPPLPKPTRDATVFTLCHSDGWLYMHVHAHTHTCAHTHRI